MIADSEQDHAISKLHQVDENVRPTSVEMEMLDTRLSKETVPVPADV